MEGVTEMVKKLLKEKDKDQIDTEQVTGYNTSLKHLYLYVID